MAVRWRNSCFKPLDPVKRSIRRLRNKCRQRLFPHQFLHQFPHRFPHRFPRRRTRRWKGSLAAFPMRILVVSTAVDPGGMTEGQMGCTRIASRWATGTIACDCRRSIVARWIPAAWGRRGGKVYRSRGGSSLFYVPNRYFNAMRREAPSDLFQVEERARREVEMFGEDERQYQQQMRAQYLQERERMMRAQYQMGDYG